MRKNVANSVEGENVILIVVKLGTPTSYQFVNESIQSRHLFLLVDKYTRESYIVSTRGLN